MKPGIDYIGVVVVFVCHDGQGNFLLSKRGSGARDGHGNWEFGGGKVEFGETTEEALQREIKEEYGCSISIEGNLPPLSVIRENGANHWVVLPFVGRVNPAEIKINDTEAITEIGWFTLDNFPEPMHSGMLPLLEKYSEQLKKYVSNN